MNKIGHEARAQYSDAISDGGMDPRNQQAPGVGEVCEVCDGGPGNDGPCLCGLNAPPSAPKAQPVCPHCKGDPGLDCNSFGRPAPPSAPVGVEATTLERIALLFTRSGTYFVGDRDECLEKARQAVTLAQQPATPIGEAVATVSGEFSEVRQDGEVYWLQTVLLKRPQQLPFGAPLYTAPQQPAADCTCPHQDAREPDHDVDCPARPAPPGGPDER